MNKKRIQPPELLCSPAYSQGIEITGPHSLLLIGGQNGVDQTGRTVGQSDFMAQSVQALRNVKAVLDASGYTIGDVVKLTIYYVQGNDARQGFRAFQEVFGVPELPPTISGIQVAGLAAPDRLIEIEAIAVK